MVGFCEKIHTYERWLQREYGLKDITRSKPKHAQAYIDQMLDKQRRGVRGGSPSTINSFIHTLHSFSNLAKDGDTRPCSWEKKNDCLNTKTNIKQRKASETTCLMANAEDFKKVIGEIERFRSPQKQKVIEIHRIQRGVGCRIQEAIGMKKEDVQFYNDKAIIYISDYAKGGLERWVTVRDKETIELLKERTENKRDDAFIFQLKDRKGNDKSIESSINLVQDVIDKAVNRAGVERGGARYSSHSGRKVYAQEKVNEYSKMSEKQLRKELARQINDYPLDENGRNKLKEKYDSELQEIRNKIRLEIEGKRTKQQGKELRKQREFNHKELCLFLSSVSTGHFRINIMRYYCKYRKQWIEIDE